MVIYTKIKQGINYEKRDVDEEHNRKGCYLNLDKRCQVDVFLLYQTFIEQRFIKMFKETGYEKIIIYFIVCV